MNLIAAKNLHQPGDWQAELADLVTDLDQLLALLDLRRADLTAAGLTPDPHPDFPLRVPRAFVQRMQPGDPRDPLLRQVLPLAAEQQLDPALHTDPLQEASATRSPGLIQKYQGRALLVAAPSCAVHCRYCFRRHFPYDAHQQSRQLPALEAIAADNSISELILSGGDPLMLKDALLASLLARAQAIPHLRRLRLHTRLPVVIPSRITPTLLEVLGSSRLPVVLVLHINHAREIDTQLGQAIAALRHTGITLLNQAVLLRGVNADADSLVALSEALFAHGVLPYYLHLPDQVQGTRHFLVSAAEGRALLAAISARLPGYLVPKLAQEVPGEAAKQVLSVN